MRLLYSDIPILVNGTETYLAKQLDDTITVVEGLSLSKMYE